MQTLTVRVTPAVARCSTGLTGLPVISAVPEIFPEGVDHRINITRAYIHMRHQSKIGAGKYLMPLA